MAHVMHRSLLALPLAALAILVANLPPRPPAEPDRYRGEWQDYPTPEGRLAKRLGDDYRRAEGRAHTRSLRDSLMRVVTARGVRPGAVTTISPARFDSAAHLITRLAAPPVPSLSPDIRTALVLVPTDPWLWSSTSSTYLPAATDGRTCIASRGIDQSSAHATLRYPSKALGPCAFFAAFGLPGPEIGRWLSMRGYEFAIDPDWVTPEHTIPPEDEPTIGLWAQTMLERMTTSTGHMPTSTAWFYWHSFSESGCAAGRVDACRRFFFSDVYEQPVMPGVVGYRGYYYSATEGLLATLVREQGVDRFARFWHSQLQPERAFDSAFAVPFARWAPAWANAAIGPVRVDQTTRSREVSSSLLWIGLCLGAVAGLAVTRRVA